MTRDPLQTMLRIRREALDEAQTAVADAHRVEQDAAGRAAAAAAALDQEMKAATDLAAGDDAVETFARWLPIGRRTLTQARDGHGNATAALDRSRAFLALARAGVRSVECLIDQRRAEARLQEDRREQRMMDEVGSRRRQA